jgi:hypothetical protein
MYHNYKIYAEIFLTSIFSSTNKMPPHEVKVWVGFKHTVTIKRPFAKVLFEKLRFGRFITS